MGMDFKTPDHWESHFLDPTNKFRLANKTITMISKKTIELVKEQTEKKKKNKYNFALSIFETQFYFLFFEAPLDEHLKAVLTACSGVNATAVSTQL